MADSFTPTLRALVVATLLLATATLMLVVVNTARAAGALAKCQGGTCRVVTVTKRGCAAFAVDFTNACGAHGWGKGPRLGVSQNEALRSCYKDGGKECVIRTFFCDAKG